MGLTWGESLATLLASAVGEAGPADAAGRARRILEADGCQPSLPTAPAPPEVHPLDLSWLGSLGLLGRILGWTLVAILVALAAAWLWRRLSGGAEEATVEAAPPPAPLEVPIAGAEALAAAGRHGEAIHSLLLETLAALSRAARLSPSQTSREVLARTPLPARARDALAGLVAAVERSRFGGEAAGEAEYRDCLARFHAFLATYRHPGPAAAEAR